MPPDAGKPRLMLALASPAAGEAEAASPALAGRDYGAIMRGSERSAYAPPRSARYKSVAITILLFAVVIGGLFVQFDYRAEVINRPTEALVVNLLPLASPETLPRPEKKPIPEKQRQKQEKQKSTPVERTDPPPIVPLPAAPMMPLTIPKPESKTTQTPADAAAPPSTAAPPAPNLSNNAPDSWQGRVLARLASVRRYPSGARNRREQGVVYIRFVMDRSGKVLSSRLERSSGFADLDREAVSLAKRAQPLPKPPAAIAGDTIELVTPVEFFIH